MTIKEVEARTGLVRANIRYYEEQGFFSAARGENGYRNYSDEHVDTLLKIKLLRQLGFSLEEIHELQRGERSLEPALERREAALEQERRELDQAARLCRDMRSDGVSFYALDARRYLDRLAREEEIVAQDQDPVRIFPWRRLFARDLDLLLYTTLLVVFLQLIFRANVLRNAGGSFPLRLGVLLLMFLVETLSLTLTGTTPGKALLGLKILREDGSRLGLDEAALRTAKVTAFYGGSILLATLGVVLFVLIGAGMLIWACWQVYHGNPLFWEPDNQLYLDGSTRERAFWDNHRNYFRTAGCLAVWALCIGLMIGGHFLAARPPHRGASLTAEQFVDNYNQYMTFTYGRENLTQQLTLSGTFEDLPQDSGTVVIDLMKNDRLPDPFFSFRQGSGGLDAVTLNWEYESGVPLGENQSCFISIPYQEVYTAMRSLLWSRLGEKGINEAFNALVEREGNYHTVLDGIRLDCEMRFSGYHSFDNGTMVAEAGRPQSCFVECSITLDR